MLGKALTTAAAGNAAGEGLYVEEVFSTYLWEGNSTASRDIVNGIDLDGEGGLVWIKDRTSTDSHSLFTTDRGANKTLLTNTTEAEDTVGTDVFESFNSDGFTVGTHGRTNISGKDYASWTFRKAPKFFDVVTYTGNGTANTQIPHNLGSTPGCIIVKNVDNVTPWKVLFNLDSYYDLKLDSTDAASSIGYFYWGDAVSEIIAPTDTNFTVGNQTEVNANGSTHVAYLFAHNDGDGEFGEDADQDIIKCGSVLISSSTPGTDVVDLGFEPQWVLIKRATGTEDWIVLDNMRGLAAPPNSSSNSNALWPNLNSAENNSSQGIGPSALYNITPTGFSIGNDLVNTGQTYIYIAIRRGPMKTPESGTEVFAVDGERGGSGVEQYYYGYAGFPVDLALTHRKSGDDHIAYSRLTSSSLITNSTAAESSVSDRFDNQEGYYYLSSGWTTDSDRVTHMFRRAPGFFDVVAYEGNGTVGRTVSHNLGVAPELMIVKRRDLLGSSWPVYASPLGNGYLELNSAGSYSTTTDVWNNTAPTASEFTLAGGGWGVNDSGYNFIAYLFATVPGVSKVGSITGTGSDQTIDCGFSSGARFVLVKRTSASGDWWVNDTERGIVVGNEPILRLNTTDAEQSTNLTDPDSSGFIAKGSVFGSGESFIFLAIA